MWRLRSAVAFFLCVWTPKVLVHGYEIRSARSGGTTDSSSLFRRRSFLATWACTGTATLLSGSPEAFAMDIKVTPLAHTFITTSGAAKPIRENDATRFFTNAKVVYLLQGKDASAKSSSLASEVMELTAKRKIGEGPGVTPGKVKLLSSDSKLTEVATGLGVDIVASKGVDSVDAVINAAKDLADGDVLVVGPLLSGGIAADGQRLVDTAKGLGTFVGGKTGRGVISVLLDGPRQGLEFEQSGYPLSELLWYSI